MIRSLFALLAVMVINSAAQAQTNGAGQSSGKTSVTCSGKFQNPITDICWSCMFPIKVAGKTIASNGSQEDYDSMDGKGGNVCACGEFPKTKIGMQTSFWEPTHIVETVRHPFCMVSLGGVGWDKSVGGSIDENSEIGKWFGGSHKPSADQTDQSNDTFYQAHWIKNPVVYILEVLLDSDCLESGSFDVGWLTELDPTWKNSALSLLQSPDAALFANPVAQAVCAADCVKANVGFPAKSLFWCAGCLGSIYPYTGFISSAPSPVQAAKLMTARMQSKMHRDLAAVTGAGERGLCGLRLQPLMDKRQYKISMTYPIAARKDLGGKCCEPIGRTTLVRDVGKSFPYKGQDFAYQVYRKRDCCAGYSFSQ